jgi:hypothetical protein
MESFHRLENKIKEKENYKKGHCDQEITKPSSVLYAILFSAQFQYYFEVYDKYLFCTSI